MVPLLRPWRIRNSSSAWASTSTMASPMPTTSVSPSSRVPSAMIDRLPFLWKQSLRQPACSGKSRRNMPRRGPACKAGARPDNGPVQRERRLVLSPRQGPRPVRRPPNRPCHLEEPSLGPGGFRHSGGGVLVSRGLDGGRARPLGRLGRPYRHRPAYPASDLFPLSRGCDHRRLLLFGGSGERGGGAALSRPPPAPQPALAGPDHGHAPIRRRRHRP